MQLGKIRVPRLGQFPDRSDELEWLESGAGDRNDAWQNLLEIERINRILGGFHSLTRHLFPLLLKVNQPISIMDVGTGSGGVFNVIQLWAKQHQIVINGIGVDISRRNIAVTANRSIEGNSTALVVMDGLHPGLTPSSVDFVISTLVMHHFKPLELTQFLKSSYEVSRCGIVMSDLIRGRAPLWAFRLVRPVFARHPFTYHDGSLSVRRAYLPQELLNLVKEAGLPNPQVFCHFPWRMILVVEK